MDDGMIRGSGVQISGGWTRGVLLLGLMVIGVCVIIPQADSHRRLAYEHAKLTADLDQINQQSAVNEAFLAKLESDPQLAQRLAERQMKFIRQGESLLQYKSATGDNSSAAAALSPFSLVHVPPPADLPAYQPPGGLVGSWLLDSSVRLICLGSGLFLVAAGLVLGSNEPHVARVGT